MKASEARFLDFIKKSHSLLFLSISVHIPGLKESVSNCGMILNALVPILMYPLILLAQSCISRKDYIKSQVNRPLLVIDGQQRLTTLSLLIAALAEHLDNLPEEQREPVEGFTPRKLRHYYLVNNEEDGDRYFKLLLSQTDRQTLIELLKGQEISQDYSHRIQENYKYFQQWISSANLSVICHGILKLLVVDVALSRDQDNPQLIFESMNSTGKELTQADLIRNYILMGLEHELQTKLYEQYWRPMEKDFGQEAYESHFDGFMRHYLTVKTGSIPRLRDVYEAFKSYSQSPEVATMDTETMVAELREYARYFCAFALGAETNPELNQAFRDLREMKVDVSYPLLLELYVDYINEVLPSDELLQIVRLIESYVFRRAICAIPTNSLNKTFAGFSRWLEKDKYVESFKAQLLLLPSYRRFPNDEEFKRELKTRDLYNFPRRSYLLRKMENYNRKELVAIDEYTIEHIMPQNQNLSKEWQDSLGDDWQRIHEAYLHTLGNLTLTGYNSEYSDRHFTQKRDMPGGFRESPLRLNQGLAQVETWNEETILNRADRLSNTALIVWPVPKIDPDILEYYRPVKEIKTEYTIEDHPYLKYGSSMYGDLAAQLFDAFRREVLALDDAVSEEFRKLYVAYKAETNFVDVIPQAKRLLLTLNMGFNDLNDPRKIAIDVTGKGRWGNGDVEVPYSSLDELPYIMGLVRQSFELQMGNGDEL
jgi:uncharacterized protein with ParB-like and HNH nuclease domain/predicted transport protein